MKSTISAVALVASLLSTAFASPLHMERNAEADIEVVTHVDVVTAFATVYATEGGAAPPTATHTAPAAETTTVPADYGRGKGRNRSKYTWHQDTSTSSEAPPPPPPTTSSTSVEPAPTPSTTSTSETPVVPAYTPAAETPTYVAPTSAAAPVYSAPAAASTPITYDGDASFNDANLQGAILDTTNHYRAMFQAKPVVWNQTLADMAAASVQSCDFEHSNFGQNLAASMSGAQPGVEMWGDEYKKYDFSNPSFTEDTGHFSQLVWQDTATTGCAAKKCPSTTSAKGWYLICNYYPPGNWVMPGEFAQNVKTQVSS